MENKLKILILASISLLITNFVWADAENLLQDTSVEAPQNLALATNTAERYLNPLGYTLGPEDTIDIIVARHPELSGTFPVNLEGKIQYKFVGDIDVTGLTKKQLEEKIKQAISSYVINPQVNVTVLEYNSKVIYVLGEVGIPGKYNMRAESITVREAVVNAGLPTLSAAMRKCRIITPDKGGRAKVRSVNLYAVLYGGNLKYNYVMHAGDVLYVPSTVMAKVIRVINPVTTTMAGAAAGPDSANTGRVAARDLRGPR